ncbi:MAG: hypothetical protein JST12_09505 [Armatimonadetes bacterium]|nr:hypothetical protein [Armatimonadota bacterium]
MSRERAFNLVGAAWLILGPLGLCVPALWVLVTHYHDQRISAVMISSAGSAILEVLSIFRVVGLWRRNELKAMVIKSAKIGVGVFVVFGLLCVLEAFRSPSLLKCLGLYTLCVILSLVFGPSFALMLTKEPVRKPISARDIRL